jgi:hypothetical protein
LLSFVAERLSAVKSADTNFGGQKFKGDRELETVATQWHVTQGTDLYKQEMVVKMFVPKTETEMTLALHVEVSIFFVSSLTTQKTSWG